MRDFTALGGVGVLTLATLATIGYLTLAALLLRDRDALPPAMTGAASGTDRLVAAGTARSATRPVTRAGVGCARPSCD